MEQNYSWTPSLFITLGPTQTDNFNINIEHFCALVVHPITGETIANHKKLATDPVMQNVWETAFGKEFDNLAQGNNKTKTEGTNSVFIMSHEEIKKIPKDRTVA